MKIEQKYIDRFWARVDKSAGPNGCWTWTAGKNGQGYGLFWNGRAQRGAHRIAWELANGPIPAGLFILHRCDNPACVNPDHLFLGTQGDNNKDRAAKGRSDYRKGSKNPFSKLTADEVRAIRRKYATGKYTCDELGLEYKISGSHISNILLRNRWDHV